MKLFLEQNPLILMEAAIVEQLRRSPNIQLHDSLVNAPGIYDPECRQAMTELYQHYMQQAENASLPILLCTPTWRANRERVENSSINQRINQDAVAFMHDIKLSDNVKIGGMIGCKNDCYRPDQALSTSEAEQFHTWQIQQLAETDVDYLIAVTLPNVDEALGIAKAMAKSQKPYIISFVISRNGKILDGTTLTDAIALIDTNTAVPPIGYMVNCAYPTFLCPQNQPAELFPRFIGFQANASSLDHCALDNTDELKIDDIDDWGTRMLDLNYTYGIQILGGCCGTGTEHLNFLIENRE